MNLPWYLWCALVVCCSLFLADCAVFYRNAERAEFSLANLLVMTVELIAAVWLVVVGMR